MADPTGVIDRVSSLPFYYQLQKLLKHQIESGRWSHGDRLPSEPVLSDFYGLSRGTVRQALHTLEQEGLIRKERGRGAFVNRTSSGAWLLQWAGGVFDDELIRHGITVESVLIRGAVEPLPSWAGQALQLGADAKGVTLERLRLVDGHVALYVVNHLPPDYVVILPEMERNSSASLYRTLCEHCGAKVAGSSRTLEAVSAPAVLAHRLGVPVRYPLVYVQSVSRNAMGHPIDCYRAWLRTDTIRIAIETDTWASLTGRVVNHSFLDVLNENNVRTI